MLRVVVCVAVLSFLHPIARAELSACLQKYKAGEFTDNIPVYPRAALRHGFSAGGTLHIEVLAPHCRLAQRGARILLRWQ